MLRIRLARPSAAQTKTLLYYLFVVGAPSSIFLWHLKSQTAGLSAAETALRSSAKLSNIRSNPLNLPYKLLDNGLYHSGLNHIFAMRLGSALVGMALVAAFFYVLKGWFGKPIALLTVLLVALTPLYLLSSRTATGNIMLASSIFILAAYYHYNRGPSGKLSLSLLLLSLISCLYVPGLVWLLLIAAIFWLSKIKEFAANLDGRQKIWASAGTLLMLVPLLYGFVTHPSLIRAWLLLPAKFPGALTALGNFGWGIASMLVRLRASSDLSVGRLPLLNAVQIGLLAFGVYVMWSRLRGTFYWMLASVALVLILFSLSDSFEVLLMAVPYIAFLSGMGLRYLFVEWRKVFPKNPLAKAFAIILMSAVVGMHIFFGIRYSLLAWPATPAVRQAYVLK
jgi:hypothetical protein